MAGVRLRRALLIPWEELWNIKYPRHATLYHDGITQQAPLTLLDDFHIIGCALRTECNVAVLSYARGPWCGSVRPPGCGNTSVVCEVGRRDVSLPAAPSSLVRPATLDLYSPSRCFRKLICRTLVL